MQPRINVITLGVEDLQRSLDFYKGGLGWRAKVQGDIAFFQLNGVLLALYPKERLAKDAEVSPQGHGFRGITLAYNCRDEGEVDSVLSLVKSIGVNIVKPAQKTFWGGYSGYFFDPDGHLWEVAHNPFWELDPEGNVRL
jgi:catechol 2,3-dioxygenase-like lactoylglutathione lyase family enzyme